VGTIAVALLAAQLSSVGIPYFRKEWVSPGSADFLQALMPGSVVELYGRNLALLPLCGPDKPIPPHGPYPTEICGVRVLMAGKPAGLLYVSSEQINLQIPADVPNPGPAPVQVWVGDRHSDPVMCDFGRPRTQLRLLAPAYVGMPVWIGLRRAYPNETRYPYSTDPWDFGGEFELKHNGTVVPPWKPAPITAELSGSLSGMFGGVPGSPTGRLPLHLAFRFMEPGKYSVRFTGYQTQPAPGGMRRVQVDESDWFDFEVLPFDAAVRDRWASEQKQRWRSAKPGELVGDILPSLLAAPDEWLLDRLLQSTYEPGAGQVRGFVDLVVKGYPLESLRAFGEPMLRKSVSALVRTKGPSPQIARMIAGNRRLFDDDAALAAALASALESGAATIETGVISLIVQRPEVAKGSAASIRGALWRMSGGKQSLIALAAIADPRDLEPLAGRLTKQDPADPAGYRIERLAQSLWEHYHKTALPYLRTALQNAKQPRVRRACALELARGGQKDGFAALLDAIDEAGQERGEILYAVRQNFPGMKSASENEILTFLRSNAGR
jgi:hypothetical protein